MVELAAQQKEAAVAEELPALGSDIQEKEKSTITTLDAGAAPARGAAMQQILDETQPLSIVVDPLVVEVPASMTTPQQEMQSAREESSGGGGGEDGETDTETGTEGGPPPGQEQEQEKVFFLVEREERPMPIRGAFNAVGSFTRNAVRTRGTSKPRARGGGRVAIQRRARHKKTSLHTRCGGQNINRLRFDDVTHSNKHV